MSSPAVRSMLPPLLAGLVLLAAGLALAWSALPEARSPALPERERFTHQLTALLRRHGAEPAATAPRLRVTTRREDTAFAYRWLGDGAASWLTREGRALHVEASTAARWGESQGHLQITFSSRVEPWSAQWMPDSLAEFFSTRAAQPEAICGPLLRRGETTGEPLPWVGGQQLASTLLPVVGSARAAHLMRADPLGASIICLRRPGPPRIEVRDFEADLLTERWPQYVLGRLLPFGAVVVLFVVLALRGRIDLWNGVVLAALFLLSTLLSDWPASALGLLGHAVAAGAVALWLVVLWSSSESWARSHLPAFATSLDTLRRGRLGSGGGRALLLGFAGGAALAGLRLAVFAAARLVPGIDPAEPAAQLPLFALGDHPLRQAMVWLALLLLAVTAAHRLVPRLMRVAAPLGAGLLVEPVALQPWWAQYLGAVALTAVLAWILHRAGPTAALLAALLMDLLPAGALALRHAGWMPGTAALAAGLALAPLLLGWIGLRRGTDVERDPGAVPEFLRREEREKRLSYEMDLLARMQLGLLPQGLPRLPGYELTARSILATEAGGDLYDFLRDERGRLWIAAGDVSGHGYSCAIAQASVKAALLSLVDGEASPARVLARVDRVLRGIVGGRQYATLCLVCLEESSGRLRLANAGHPFPLLAEPGRGTRELEHPGLPLGQGPPRRYRDVEVQLQRGAVLLLHSDGLFEALDPGGQAYGFDRPRQVLADAASWNAAEVLERLLWDWRRHLAGAAPPDDTTLVVLKRG